MRRAHAGGGDKCKDRDLAHVGWIVVTPRRGFKPHKSSRTTSTSDPYVRVHLGGLKSIDSAYANVSSMHEGLVASTRKSTPHMTMPRTRALEVVPGTGGRTVVGYLPSEGRTYLYRPRLCSRL